MIKQQEKQKKIDNFAIKKIVDGIVILDNEHAYAPSFHFYYFVYYFIIIYLKKKLICCCCVFFFDDFVCLIVVLPTCLTPPQHMIYKKLINIKKLFVFFQF